MPGERERLTKYVKDIEAQRDLERERQKPTPNQRMAEEAKDFNNYEFWCEKCEVDFNAPAYKTIHRLMGDYMAVYRAIHEDCGEECIRYITHRDHDPYYQMSEKILRQRNEYADDVLMHDQYGFKTLWGEPFEDYYKRLQEKEEKIIKGELDKGFKGLSYETQESLNRLHATI